jgi:hypothetical protein
LKEQFEAEEHLHDEDGKRFLKLFEESTFEGSRAAARKMKKIAKRQTKYNKKFLLTMLHASPWDGRVRSIAGYGSSRE